MRNENKYQLGFGLTVLFCLMIPSAIAFLVIEVNVQRELVFLILAAIYAGIVIFGLISAIYLVRTYRKYRDGSIPSGDELILLTCPGCNAPLDSKPPCKCQYCGIVVSTK